MTKFQRKLKIQLLILSVIILMAIISIIHTAFYVMSRRFVVEELTLNAQTVAVAVAEFINEDIEAYKDFLEKVDAYKAEQGFAPTDIILDKDKLMPHELYANDPYYQRIINSWRKVKESGVIKYIYTSRKLDEHTLEYILDVIPIDDDTHTPPGTSHAIDIEQILVYETGQPTRFGLNYYEEWGWLLGAHAPLFDTDGEVLGVVGVDLSGSHLSQYLNRLQFFLCVVYAFIIGMTLFIVTKYSFVIMEPLFKDRLTGAYTKRYANRLIQEEIAAIAKYHSSLALMVLDLDLFKNVNDTYGHSFGDKVLATLSEKIQRILRHKDYFIRYGGEEFIALFPNVDENQSLEIAERIRTTVSNTEIVNTEKNIVVKMTISIGVAILAHSSTGVSEFIDQADKALYVAKKTRNCVSLYTPEMEELLEDAEESKLYLASAIRRK